MNLDQRARAAVLIGTMFVALGCDDEKKPATSEPAQPAPTPSAPPPPARPESKPVPKDVKEFLAWVEKAGPAIEKGPDATDAHPILGKVSCQENKEAPDFGFCGSSKEGPPRFAAQWPAKDTSVWAANLVLESAASHVNCDALDKQETKTSDEKNVIAHRCEYSDQVEMWVRHSTPPGGKHSTAVWVFSKDFPKQDDEAALGPRATLYAKLNE